ncbi:hypothetical protein PIB30_107234, partial [Stylosanthes scabra]|nr:hypothetical protein [Stylosanthes scabra]
MIWVPEWVVFIGGGAATMFAGSCSDLQQVHPKLRRTWCTLVKKHLSSPHVDKNF